MSGGGFYTGVAPPKSKYSNVTFRLENLDICSERKSPAGHGKPEEEDEEEDWMCSSSYESRQDGQPVVKEVEVRTDTKLQRFTSQQWLDEIESRYFGERDDLVRQTLQAALDDVKETFSFLLHVMFTAHFDLYSKRIPITFLALDELEIWIDLKRTNGEAIPQPAECHKRQAMEFLCKSGYNYLDKVNKVFQLDVGDNAYLAEYIRIDPDISAKKLKQIVVIITTVKLHHQFNARDVMLPLLVSDQIQVLETYVGEDRTLQEDYAQFMDWLCGMDEDTVEEMVVAQGMAIKDPSKLQHKTIIKMAEKVVKRYDLNPDDYPQVFTAKNIASLCYLVRMKCKEERKTSSDPATCEKWNQLIETSVRGKPFLQVKLIETLVQWGNVPDACKYARKYYVAPDKLPDEVHCEIPEYVRNYRELGTTVVTKKFTGDSSASATEEEEENWDESCTGSVFSLTTGFLTRDEAEKLQEQYYQLNIPKENILLIRTVEELENLSRNLLSTARVIGFDAEWKPTMCRAGEQDRVSILQLAVVDTVYIVDLFVLYVTPNAEDALKTFFTIFFTSQNIIKIGYGIVGDLKILIGMFGYVKELVAKSVLLVDLGEVAAPLLSHPVVIPYLFPPQQAAMAEKGLSLLVNRTLGKRLNKTFQVSDWEVRPLSHDQLHYAALDAYCLLEVYSFLQHVVKETKVKANLTANVKLKWLKMPKAAGANKRKDKFANRDDKERIPENKPLFKGVPRPSTQLKVVCDTMLQGLGKYLRACGVDAVVLESHQDHSTVINICLKEKRVILTRGKPFFMLRGYVPEGMCMWVPEGTLKEQLKMIFTRYNIALQSKDILCRCTACNSSKYTTIKAPEMKLTYELKHEVGDSEMPASQMTESGLIDLTNFTLSSGVELQLDFVPPSKYERGMCGEGKNMFTNVDVFYACEQCGKVYWEGSHHTAVKMKFSDLIDRREVDGTAYGTPG